MNMSLSDTKIFRKLAVSLSSFMTIMQVERQVAWFGHASTTDVGRYPAHLFMGLKPVIAVSRKSSGIILSLVAYIRYRLDSTTWSAGR